jgi:hypothetical protein
MKLHAGKDIGGIDVSHATKASQVFFAAGDWHVTARGLPGETLRLPNDLLFNRWMGLSQNQNTNCEFGFVDGSGELDNDTPRSAMSHAQGQVMLYKQPKANYADLAHAGFIEFRIGDDGRPAVFFVNLG